MNKNQKILLRDPWRVVEDRDTGFGNRLICWYVINTLTSHTQPEIQTFLSEFPELEYLNLPNTTTLKPPYPPTSEEGIISLNKKYKSITDDHILSYIKNKEIYFDDKFNFTTDYSWDSVNTFIQNLSITPDYFKDIKIKSPQLEDAILEFSKDIIGIHVRRGNGVRSTQKDIKDIPQNVWSLFPLNPKADPFYKFFPEKKLINIIEAFLYLNPNTKIYLSLDLPEETVNHLKIKYKGSILTRSNFITHNYELITSLNFLKPILHLKSIGNNLIDFFILANSQFIIESSGSTWTQTGKLITGKPSGNINESINSLVDKYKKTQI